MFENQPKGLWALALANTGERFGYYTMLAVFLLYLQANFGFETGLASTIYSTFLMMVYFLPIIIGHKTKRIFDFVKQNDDLQQLRMIRKSLHQAEKVYIALILL